MWKKPVKWHTDHVSWSNWLSGLSCKLANFRMIGLNNWFLFLSLYNNNNINNTEGKFITSILTVTGVVVVALPIPIIVNNFTRFYERIMTQSEKYQFEFDENKSNENNNTPLVVSHCETTIWKKFPKKRKHAHLMISSSKRRGMRNWNAARASDFKKKHYCSPNQRSRTSSIYVEIINNSKS